MVNIVNPESTHYVIVAFIMPFLFIVHFFRLHFKALYQINEKDKSNSEQEKMDKNTSIKW